MEWRSHGGELRLLRVLMLVLRMMLLLLRGSTGRLRWRLAAIAATAAMLLRVARDGGVRRGLIGANGLLVLRGMVEWSSATAVQLVS